MNCVLALRLRRVSRRTLVRTLTVGALVSVALTALFGAAFGIDSAQQDSANRGLSWLRSRQNSNGSFSGFSLIGGTSELVYAVRAADQDPGSASWTTDGANALSWLRAETQDPGPDSIGEDPRDGADLAAKVAIAAVAAGTDARSFGGVNLVELINQKYDSNSGAFAGKFGSDVFAQALAVLGLAATQEPIPDNAVDRLLAAQLSDGGWTYPGGVRGETNYSAIALQALAAAEARGNRVTEIQAAKEDAIAFYHSEQLSDGGFYFQKTEASNYCGGLAVSDANSTAYSIQALRAAGQRPDSSSWRTDGRSPVTVLRELQASDGSFAYQQGEGTQCESLKSGATLQAVPAVLERSFLCLVRIAECPNRSSSNSAAAVPLAPDLGPEISAPAPTPTSQPKRSATSQATLQRPARRVATPVPSRIVPSPAPPLLLLTAPAQSPPAAETGRLSRKAAPDQADPQQSTNTRRSRPYFPVLGGLVATGVLLGSIVNRLRRLRG